MKEKDGVFGKWKQLRRIEILINSLDVSFYEFSFIII